MKLGRTLKDTRIKRGIALSDAAKELLINERYLEAIEDEIDDILPSDTYRRIYTRAYCRFLGVEYKESVPETETVTVVLPNQKSLTQQKSPTQKSSSQKTLKEKTVDELVKKVPQDTSDDFTLDLPFDINRVFRIFLKVAGTILVIYLIVKFFQWVF